VGGYEISIAVLYLVFASAVMARIGWEVGGFVCACLSKLLTVTGPEQFQADTEKRQP
jgi:hypothetical protein